MPKRLPEEKRQAIADAIRTGSGWRARNDIAREFGVAASTVGKIAEDEGLDEPFDRTNLARAAKAKQVDNRARRAQLIEDYLDDAARIRLRLWEPAEQVAPSGQIVMLSLPQGRDVQSFTTAGSMLIKTTLEVEKHDMGDQGAEDAKSMLLGVAEGLRAMYVASQMEAEPADPDA